MNKPFVHCDNCDEVFVESLPGLDFLCFSNYKCIHCGWSSKYPLQVGFELFYWFFVSIFLIWLFVFLFIDMNVTVGLFGAFGLLFLPVVIINQNIKSKRPNYKQKMFNSKNTTVEEYMSNIKN